MRHFGQEQALLPHIQSFFGIAEHSNQRDGHLNE